MKTENWALEKIIPYEKNPRKNDKAVAILALDDSIPDKVMEEIRAIPNIFDANLVHL